VNWKQTKLRIAYYLSKNRWTWLAFTVLDRLRRFLFGNIRARHSVDEARFRADSLVAMDRAIEILDRHGVRYWLDCGTLLGAMRNKDPFLGDIDIGIYGDDVTLRLVDDLAPIMYNTDGFGFFWAADSLRQALTAGGPHKVRYIRVLHDTGFCDIHLYFAYGEHLILPCRAFTRDYAYNRIPAALLDRFEELEVGSRRLRVPGRTQEVLEWWYGPGWRTPDPIWDHEKNDHVWTEGGIDLLYDFATRTMEKRARPRWEWRA
jgi:hypothetical protein